MSEKSFLFPIISSNSGKNYSDTQTRAHTSCSFPSVCVPDTEEKESLNWLSNASYNIQADAPFDILKEGNESTSSHFSSSEAIIKKAKFEQTEENSTENISRTRNLQQSRKHPKNKKSKKHKKHKLKTRKKSIDDPKLMKLPSTIWIEESGLEIEKAFRIHRQPDIKNCQFDGLYRLDIALHHQNPKLKCLGLSKEQDIEPKSKKKEKKKPQLQRYWEGSLSSDENVSFDQTATRDSGFGFSTNFSYVPLGLPIAENESPSLANEKPACELLLRTKELNQKVRANPDDIQSWLALADLQAQHFEPGNITSDSLNKTALDKQKKSSKFSIQKKAAVLEQAVQKNPLCVDLIVAYMKVCSETLNNEAILDKWRNFLFIQPQKTLLWKHYLMFCQSSFSAFSFSATLEVYAKCFKTLSAIQSGKFVSHSPENDIESGMIEVFVQFCQFLMQAGQIEKTIATFQALIEFNLFNPSLQEEHSLLSFFEAFWDSEVPRFGEENAPGWSKWIDGRSKTSHTISISEIFLSNSTQDQNLAEDKIIGSHSEKPSTWLKLETSREAEQWCPKRTSSEDDENDDPDRIVLFQDIHFVLFKISDEKHKFQLLVCFLAFLGISVNINNSVQLETEKLLVYLLDDERQLTSSTVNGCGRVFGSLLDPGDAKHIADIPRHTFVRNMFNQSMECFSGALQTCLATCWLNFEKEVLSKTNTNQHKQCYRAARKLAKTMLKLERYRNNLGLWFAFIEIEWVNGNVEEARRIVCSLLEQLQNVADEISVRRYYNFVRLYCEMEMGFKGENERNKKTAVNLEECKNRILSAIYVLVNRTGSIVQAVLSPVQILRAHKVLQELSASMLSELETWDFGTIQEERKAFLVDFSLCYAVFQYWSLGINAAKSVLNSFLSAVCLQRTEDDVLPDHPMKFSGSKHHRELLAFYCNVLQFHSRNNICPVKPLREHLLTSLSAFPENVFFLHSYVMLELRSCTSYSVRRYFDSVLARSKTPVPWLFAIHYERQRQKTYQSLSLNTLTRTINQEHTQSIDPVTDEVTEMAQTGVVHRLRSLYERAIHHPSARNCVAIWRSYIKFEAEIGDRRQAKAIFYQSLQSCAWAKVIYLDAIKLFPELFQDVHDMMEDKELRVRAPLEELELLIAV